MYFEKRLPYPGIAEKTKSKILSLKDSWNEYPDRIKTIGTPAYKHDFNHERDVGEENFWLWQSFEDLYKEIIGLCSSVFNANVFLDPRIPFPGFHIFVEDMARKFYAAPCHTDMSYLRIPILNNLRGSLSDHYTLIFCVEVPERGTSTEFFPGINPAGDVELEQNLTPAYELAHEKNKAFIFKSEIPHRISAFELTGPSDSRITFQGHLAKTTSGYILYW